MITIVDKYNTVEYRGLSTDTKPTAGVFNGSSFVEIDSGKRFLFNAAASQWVEYAGGGSDGGGAFCVTLTVDDSGEEPVWSSDKTLSEIRDAYDHGLVVYAVTVGDDNVNIMPMVYVAETVFGFKYTSISIGGYTTVAYAEIYENDDGETEVYMVEVYFDLSSLIVEP